MIDSASSTELGEPTVAQPLFVTPGPARRAPLVRRSGTSGLGATQPAATRPYRPEQALPGDAGIRQTPTPDDAQAVDVGGGDLVVGCEFGARQIAAVVGPVDGGRGE